MLGRSDLAGAKQRHEVARSRPIGGQECQRCRPSQLSHPPRSSFSAAIGPCARSGAEAPAPSGSHSTSGTASTSRSRSSRAKERRRRGPSERRSRHAACVTNGVFAPTTWATTRAMCTSPTSTCPGRTLRETIRAGALSDRDAVAVAAQVLDALAHAHRAGIVHRDVKPANILVEDCDELAIRLLDFGLAQFDGADTLTAVGDVPGTLAYISPERLAGGDATPESDVWSVGVLLWETLTDRHPFWGVPIQEVANSIQAGAPPLATERRGLPRRLVAAVDAALAIDPAARPNASDLAAELRNALRSPQSRPARKERATKHEKTLAPAQRHARRAVPVALGVVTAVLGATFLPFWPPELVAALVVATAIACWLDPRAGLALVLAVPVFPIGNVAESAAIVYGALAAGWLVLNWRDARHGLLFVIGPVLAAFGLLPLVPLVVQRADGRVRRAAHAAVAVLAAALLAGVAGHELPLTGEDAGHPRHRPAHAGARREQRHLERTRRPSADDRRSDPLRARCRAPSVGETVRARRRRDRRVRRHRGLRGGRSRRHQHRRSRRRLGGCRSSLPPRSGPLPSRTHRSDHYTRREPSPRPCPCCAASNRRSRACSRAYSDVLSGHTSSRSSWPASW